MTLGRRLKREPLQPVSLISPESVVTSWSMCAGSMTNGGYSAIVSPVVRIRIPFSNAFTKIS
jgi:hypothetical protein